MSSDEGSQLVTVLQADGSFKAVKIPGPPGMEGLQDHPFDAGQG